MDGTFNLARKMFDGHDDFWPAPGTRVYTKAEAWIDLVYLARFRPTETENGSVPRGAVSCSLRFLATRWSWSIKQVRGFLSKCENLGRIKGTQRAHLGAHGRAHLTTLYSLVNYDTYQGQPCDKGHTPGHTPGSEKGTKRTKRTKEENTYVDEFELLWVVWKGRPNNPKKEALRGYGKLRNSGVSLEELKEACRAYYLYCKHRGILGTDKMLQARTFFGPNERWKADFTVAGTSGDPAVMGFDDSDFFTGDK